VGAATAGSLLAVSLLGQGIAPTTSQQLTAADVYQALTTEASEASVPAISWPIPTPSRKPPHKTRAAATAAAPLPSQTEAAPLAGPAASQPATAPNPAPTRGVVSVSPSTALTSQGGTVVADCQLGEVYLVSWSPAQGYEAGQVVRGPAATAQATFESNANIVTMVVSCSSGVPTSTTTTSPGDGASHSDE
jgi:serine/threonine-protein kinase